MRKKCVGILKAVNTNSDPYEITLVKTSGLEVNLPWRPCNKKKAIIGKLTIGSHVELTFVYGTGATDIRILYDD